MTLMIDLNDQLEARLRAEASRHGFQTAEYAKLLIEQSLTAPLDLRKIGRLSTFWTAGTRKTRPMIRLRSSDVPARPRRSNAH